MRGHKLRLQHCQNQLSRLARAHNLPNSIPVDLVAEAARHHSNNGILVSWGEGDIDGVINGQKQMGKHGVVPFLDWLGRCRHRSGTESGADRR